MFGANNLKVTDGTAGSSGSIVNSQYQKPDIQDLTPEQMGELIQNLHNENTRLKTLYRKAVFENEKLQQAFNGYVTETTNQITLLSERVERLENNSKASIVTSFFTGVLTTVASFFFYK